MELFVYDTHLNAIGVVDAITSLIWTRRYQTAGECSLMVPYRADYAQMLKDGRLLMRRRSTEAMQIYSNGISENDQGAEQIEIQGKSLMSWLDRRIMLKQIISSGLTGQAILRRMIEENMTNPEDAGRYIPMTGIYDRADYGDAPIADYESDERAFVQDCAEALLPTANLGMRVLTDVKAKTHRFDMYRGRDLTIAQSANPQCIFSTDFDTLGAHTYTHSTEAYRTTAYVFGADNSVTVGQDATGLDRREMAVDASDIAKKYTNSEGVEITLTTAQLLNVLNQRGTEELGKALEELTFDGVINRVGRLKYGTDFDVGDRVTCVDRRWGISLDVGISEATETFQGENVETRVTFGGGTPTLRTTVRQISRR